MAQEVRRNNLSVWTPINLQNVLVKKLDVFIPTGITVVPEGALVVWSNTNSRYELDTTGTLDENPKVGVVYNKTNVADNGLNSIDVIVWGVVDRNRLLYLNGTTFSPLTSISSHNPNIKVI
jgi:hypothetical protein